MNFDYFKDNEDFKALYQNCENAENLCFSQPTLSVTCAGVANEMVVRFLYESLVGPSDDMTIYDMLMDWNFRKDIGYDQNLLNDFHFVRKMRNEVMHKGKICSIQDSALVLSHLSHAVQYLFNQLGLLSGYPSFVDPRDQKNEKNSVSNVSVEKEENVPMDSKVVAKYSDKLRYTIFSTESKWDEEENKKRFFIASLTDSGWPIVNRNNVFLPCSATLNLQLENKEKCDAALYGRDSKPLAIIEYVHLGESVIERRCS